MIFSQEQIDRANAVNLESFLQERGERLKRCGKDMEWEAHDSLKIRGNRWHRFSNDTGGYPINFVMEFYDKSFPEAVELLLGDNPGEPCQCSSVPDPPVEFVLPPQNATSETAKSYLVTERGIDESLVEYFIQKGDIYEDARYHNVVFVGFDRDRIPRYAHCRGTGGKLRLDVAGSDKRFGFCHHGIGDKLFVFEAAIDLMSFICLFPENCHKHSYLSLGGVSYKALQQFIEDRKDIASVYLCLDNDSAGEAASIQLNSEIPEDKKVYRITPIEKDWNELLKSRDKYDRSRWFTFRGLR